MSSVHKQCGADIVWAHREDDPERFYPPMEYVGEVFLLEGKGRDKIAQQRHAYRIHQCDPDRIVEWQEYQHKLAEAMGEEYERITPYEAAREKRMEDTWKLALKVPCPRCEQPKDKKCISLATHLIKTGEIIETRNPHPARMVEFERWHRDES